METTSDKSPEPSTPMIVERRAFEPGDYLVEMEFTEEIDDDVLRGALSRMGWSDAEDSAPLLDTSIRDERVTVDIADEATNKRLETWRASESKAPAFRARFVGRLETHLMLSDSPRVRWSVVRRLSFDPFADITDGMAPLELLTGKLYEIRFVSRMKAEPRRDNVAAVLATMGFVPDKLSCLKKNMRLKGRPGVSCALWCGLARWEGPRTRLSLEEPLCFEDAREVER